MLSKYHTLMEDLGVILTKIVHYLLVRNFSTVCVTATLQNSLGLYCVATVQHEIKRNGRYHSGYLGRLVKV